MALPMHVVEAIEEFEAARYRAFRQGIWAGLTRRRRRMPVLGNVRIERQAYRGVQEISLDRVVGSVDNGRAGDLDAGFLPTTTLVRPRWIRLYVLALEGPELPPIDVRKVGDRYFVIDGHHRVSVYRAVGRATIMARVTEVWTGGTDQGVLPGMRADSAAMRFTFRANARETVVLLGNAMRSRLPVAAFARRTFRAPLQLAGGTEVCWSCGQRNSHKLWCPNR